MGECTLLRPGKRVTARLKPCPDVKHSHARLRCAAQRKRPCPDLTDIERLWPRVEMRGCFVLSELRRILLVRLCRVEIAKSDRHNRFSHRCKLAKHLSRAQPRETIRDAKSAHAPAPLRKKVESKFRRGKSGNFGDLSRGPLFVFCEIRCVLIPEFGDLIWRNSPNAKRRTDIRKEKLVAKKWTSFAAQHKPFEARGEPLAAHGKPFAVQGKHEWRPPSADCLLRRLFLRSTYLHFQPNTRCKSEFVCAFCKSCGEW